MSEDSKFGYIKEGKIFKLGINNNSDLSIGEVKSTPEESLAYFKQRFDQFNIKANDFIKSIESSDNKGSFLNKTQHLKTQLQEHKGIGDYQKIWEELSKAEKAIQGYIEGNRIKNLGLKTTLLTDLEKQINNPNLREAVNEVKQIKTYWVQTGKVTEEKQDELEAKFTLLYDAFCKKRDDFFEDLNKARTETKAQYQELIDKAIMLSKAKDAIQAFDELRELHNSWKTLTSIMHKDQQELWETFREASDKINLHYNKQKKTASASLKNNLDKIPNKLKELKEKSGSILNFKEETLTELEALARRLRNTSLELPTELAEQLYGLRNEFKEKAFILKLSRNKLKGFDNQTEEEKTKTIIKVIYNLLNRDQESLSQYEDNLGKMHFNEGSFSDMVNKKVSQLKKNIKTKQQILKELKENNKQ